MSETSDHVPYELTEYSTDSPPTLLSHSRSFCAKSGPFKGRATYPNGDIYEGSFDNKQKSGFGVYTWNEERSAHVYRGQYVQGKRHGLGEMSYPSKEKYVGQWINGLRE